MIEQPISLRNVAGMSEAEANRELALELLAAQIPMIDIPVGGGFHSECAAKITGHLPPFTLRRAWVYWIVSGHVPYSVACVLYADSRDRGGPYGSSAIRVDGNCTCPEPTGNVGLYHIDTVNGLKLFAEIVRKYGLSDRRVQ